MYENDDEGRKEKQYSYYVYYDYYYMNNGIKNARLNVF